MARHLPRQGRLADAFLPVPLRGAVRGGRLGDAPAALPVGAYGGNGDALYSKPGCRIAAAPMRGNG